MNTYSPESVRDNYAELVTKRAVEIFGSSLADPEQEPLRFRYQVKVAEFILAKEIKS